MYVQPVYFFLLDRDDLIPKCFFLLLLFYFPFPRTLPGVWEFQKPCASSSCFLLCSEVIHGVTHAVYGCGIAAAGLLGVTHQRCTWFWTPPPTSCPVPSQDLLTHVPVCDWSTLLSPFSWVLPLPPARAPANRCWGLWWPLGVCVASVCLLRPSSTLSPPAPPRAPGWLGSVRLPEL